MQRKLNLGGLDPDLSQNGYGLTVTSQAIQSTNFLKILLNKRNFNMKKEVDGQLLAQPRWSHCLSCEYELRKEACKKCHTMSALQSTYEDNEHWVHLVATANSAKENDAKVARLEREVQELRSMDGRSRSPRMQPRQKALPAPPQQLALPAPGPAKKPRARGSRGAKKGKGKGGKNNNAPTRVGGSSSSSSRIADFDQLMKMGPRATKLFHPSNLLQFSEATVRRPKGLQQEACLHRLRGPSVQ